MDAFFKLFAKLLIFFEIKTTFVKIMKKIQFLFLAITLFLVSFNFKWGFFAHQRINKHAIFILPPELFPFYKANLKTIMELSVAPDERRYAVKGEAPKHYIDLDHYPDSLKNKMPFFWHNALENFSEDSLQAHGTVPWHIYLMKFKLTEAFKAKDAYKILRLSAEIGHYIADANVPLHTTKNYNGQFTNQVGIHAFWESRLPELYSENYNLEVGPAQYLTNPQKTIWQAVYQANACLDSVLVFEQKLNQSFKSTKKYAVETRNGINVKNYSKNYASKYHQLLANQVERQMQRSIKMIGDFWYTAWVDAGQPDLVHLKYYEFSQGEKQAYEEERKNWLQKLFDVRSEND